MISPLGCLAPMIGSKSSWKWAAGRWVKEKQIEMKRWNKKLKILLQMFVAQENNNNQVMWLKFGNVGCCRQRRQKCCWRRKKRQQRLRRKGWLRRKLGKVKKKVILGAVIFLMNELLPSDLIYGCQIFFYSQQPTLKTFFFKYNSSSLPWAIFLKWNYKSPLNEICHITIE